VLQTVLRLGVLDLLVDGPLGARELAAKGSVNEERLDRVLRTAVALQFLNQDLETRKYSLNEFSKPLAGDQADSAKWFVLFMLNPAKKLAWGQLAAGVKENVPPFLKATGEQNLFTFLKGDPYETKVFNNGMALFSSKIQKHGELFLKTVSLEGVKKIVDVGGGHGTFLPEILRHQTQLSGIIFDLPYVVEEAQQKKATDFEDLRGRLEFVGGDFFVSVPAGGDLYTIKFVLHDWDDDKAVAILKTIHTAMPPNGKLVVIDRVVRDRDQYSTLMDLFMMVINDGKERTKNQFVKLFDDSGFKLTNLTFENVDGAIIEGVKK